MTKINVRKKGSEFELKVAKILGNWWGEKFNRTPNSGGLRWKEDNRIEGDIVTPPNSTFGYTVECKKVEGWSLEQILKGSGEFYSWWEQCHSSAERVNKVGMLVFSKNFDDVYMSIKSVHFLKILEKYPKELASCRYSIINSPKLGESFCIILLEDFIKAISRECIESIDFIKERG